MGIIIMMHLLKMASAAVAMPKPGNHTFVCDNAKGEYSCYKSTNEMMAQFVMMDNQTRNAIEALPYKFNYEAYVSNGTFFKTNFTMTSDADGYYTKAIGDEAAFREDSFSEAEDANGRGP